jgi:hypothetical protein
LVVQGIIQDRTVKNRVVAGLKLAD